MIATFKLLTFEINMLGLLTGIVGPPICMSVERRRGTGDIRDALS
jgi:hypothetical protein